MKAQSSMEYLLIIALTLGILVPTTYLFFSYSSESNTEITDSQAVRLGRDIIITAESVYFSGEGSRIIMEANMPEDVTGISILGNRELVFNISSPFGPNEAVFFSSVNLTSDSCSGSACSLSDLAGAGLKKISIESVSNGKQVLIRRQD